MQRNPSQSKAAHAILAEKARPQLLRFDWVSKTRIFARLSFYIGSEAKLALLKRINQFINHFTYNFKLTFYEIERT